MSNVVDLGSYKEQRPESVWECLCGCQMFYIMEQTGGAKCRDCGKIVWFAIGDERDETQ